uniref:Double zinc ribbon and ankyrin repeat-containing protein 1 n=1 Tax=Esox lucius TaxID=8010 RepID=A0A3P8ZGK3_ESOLU
MTAGSIVVPLIIPIRIPPPGKAKHEIDTTTQVEIKSDTPDVTIYYTLDGSKPEVTKRQGFGESNALKYCGPICLSAGKVTVKALAVASDGRESAIVTKVFLVEYMPSKELPSVEDNEEKEYERNLPRQVLRFMFAPNAIFLSRMSFTFCPLMGIKPTIIALQQKQLLEMFFQNVSMEDSAFKNLTRTQMSRVQRETDFLRCAKCLSHRPSDPFARFCLQCGTALPPVPGQRLPPTEGGQMGLCVHCKTMVPVNTPTCVVCEAPMSPQLQPQASLRLQNKLICQSCGTGNPPHITNCVTCETKLLLPPTAIFCGQSAPPLPSGEGKLVSCTKCRRINHSDARFCDWCGSKPGHSVSFLICSRCGTSSHPYANFCGSCGVFLEGPPRGDSHTSINCSTGDNLESDQVCPSTCSLAPVPASADQQTQTVGLFYPSTTELHRKGQQVALELSRLEQMRDRRPLLTAISPGRGYWRKQLDHVCAHLRSYTQNNTEFRALIGEPRMGRLVSAVIEEDNFEVSLRINFVSAGLEKTKVSHFTIAKLLVHSSELLKTCYNDVDRTAALYCLSLHGRVNGVVTNPACIENMGMLCQGADPSCQGSDGRPALVVAVLHGHHEVLPVLVQRGADINQQSGPVNNTALHEAAALGTKGFQCAETLLGCNASIRKKNDRGLTAYDLAVTSKCSPLVSLLASKMGQGMLDKLVKSRTQPSLDVFH